MKNQAVVTEKNQAAKPAKRVSHMSAAKRSAIASKAAKAAWRTMHSKAYQRAADISRKAVERYLASRKAA